MKVLNHRSYFNKYLSLYKQSKGKIPFFSAFRYYYKWVKSLQKGRSPLNDRKAWIVYSSLEFLETILNKEMKVFEYGMGGSTLYFCNSVKQVFSVEHHKIWFEKTRDLISGLGLINWQGVNCEPEINGVLEKSFPKVMGNYMSEIEEYKGFSFFSYASSIDKFEDGYFDAVLIDGRARVSCFYHAKSKVKKGGYLILDNSERTRYKIIHDTLNTGGWTKYNFFGPGPYVDYEFWQTTIWKRED